MSKGDKVKLRIVTAVAEIIAERGSTDRLTFVDVARRAQLSSTSRISYHFKTKANLLEAVAAHVLANRCPNPICDYLANKRYLLATREGQSLFVGGMVDYFCDFFIGISKLDWNYSMIYRALLQSSDSELLIQDANAAFFNADALAFAEVYGIITGVDDFEASQIWFSTIFVPLAIQLSRRSADNQLDSKHVFSQHYPQKLIYFCRRQLLIGLGLWDNITRA